MGRIKLLCRRDLMGRPNARGQGLVDYALILLLVTLVVLATVKSLGETVRSNMYEPINNAVEGAGK